MGSENIPACIENSSTPVLSIENDSSLGFQCDSVKHFNFTAIVPGEFIINEGLSFPSQITTLKKSSVWLHWNYTYGGDYLNLIIYSHQSILYKSRYRSAPVELARRKDQ